MHRRPLFELLERYLARWPEERERVEQITRFVRAHPDGFLRTCQPGHVTGSAWVVTPDGGRCLLLWHERLGRWLQPGGHCDGETEVERTALREAHEETGLEGLHLAGADGGGPLVPLDVDVHRIPARGDEPEHLHHDVRFLVVADPPRDPPPSLRHAVRWVAAAEITRLTREESVLRMARKARRLFDA